MQASIHAETPITNSKRRTSNQQIPRHWYDYCDSNALCHPVSETLAAHNRSRLKNPMNCTHWHIIHGITCMGLWDVKLTQEDTALMFPSKPNNYIYMIKLHTPNPNPLNVSAMTVTPHIFLALFSFYVAGCQNTCNHWVTLTTWNGPDHTACIFPLLPKFKLIKYLCLLISLWFEVITMMHLHVTFRRISEKLIYTYIST